jgi:gliding motility-associated protein GldE
LDPDPYRYGFILATIQSGQVNVIIIGIIIIIILLICSGMVSASEVGFFSLSPADKKKIKTNKSKKAIYTQKLIDNPELLLATILVANNFINIAIVVISTYLTAFFFSEDTNQVLYILVQTVGVTFIILLVGEMMPKIYATKFPVKIVKIMAYPLFILSKILYPLSYLLIKSTNTVNKRLKKKHSTDISIEELSHAIELASDDLKDDKDILEGIVNSSLLDVKEIMTSRIDVFALEYDTKFTKVLGQIVESGFSRIPIYVKNLDNIKGILYIKDILPYINHPDKENFKWQQLIRSPFIVPENKKINELLSDFQTKKLHIAIIVDEYGGVSGLITLEDVLEEIVGEIHDESDEDEHNYVKLDDNTYEFDAKTSIIDFCKTVGKEYNLLHDYKGEFDSLAGLLLEINGDIPEKDQKITVGDFDFTVTSANDRRIKKIKVKINEK